MSRYAAEDGRLVFVGNLPDDARERDLDDIFGKYGRIRSVSIKKVNRPPPFGFVEFDDRRDAYDAVKYRDGYNFYGCRLRVELAKGRGGDRDRDRGRDDRDRGRRRDDRRDDRRDRDDRRRREFRPRNTGYKVLVKGLPSGTSWQDLKDHVRKVVRPVYTDVEKDRDDTVGVIGFGSADEMDRCIRELDNTEFKDPFDKSRTTVIRFVVADSGSGGRDDRSRSPARRGRSASPRGRSRSRSRTPVRDASRSRSRSPVRDDRSRSRSRSPSPMRDDNNERSPNKDGGNSRSPSPPPKEDEQQD